MIRPKRLYVGISSLALVLLVGLAAWREYSNSEQLERGRAIEATEQAKLQKSAAILAAEESRTWREKAQQAHQVNAAERQQLAAERDRYRRLYEQATHRIEASEQQHQVQVAAIPTLQDADLAISTVKVLGGAYPGHSLMIVPEAGDNSAFRANRPTIEIAMQAGLEVGHLREVEAAQTDQLKSQASEIEGWKEEIRTWDADLSIEMTSRDKAEASATEWKDSSDAFERATKKWEGIDASARRKARWGTIKDIAITGGLAGAGVASGNKYGFAAAAGVVGSWVIRRVF